MLPISKLFPEELKKRVAEVIKNNLKANQNLGQHFLSDRHTCDQIALSCGNLGESVVLEIGPGLGSLTQSILALHSGVELTALEADIRFIDILNEIGNYYKNCKLKVVHCDALRYDFHSWFEESHKNKYIIANLPYNIGTELLFLWLENPLLSNVQNITVMLQKEVVNRIAAHHNSKAYSWLSIVSQLLCDVEVLFDVPREAFTPAPKVISSIISLKPKSSIIPHNFVNLKKICSSLFQHRRKTINSILKNNSQLKHLTHFLTESELQQRPEAMSIESFCKFSLLL